MSAPPGSPVPPAPPVPAHRSGRARRPGRLSSAASVAGIVAGPLLLAGLGLTHPQELTAETATWWRDLHVILLPLFPLLGANLVWLLAGAPGPLPWLGRGAAFVYAAFYGALDVLAGIGTGEVQARAAAAGRAELAGAVPWLFERGNALAAVGVWAFLAGCAVAGAVLLLRVGRLALPGAVLLCAGAVAFMGSHIYFPAGVATMLVLAAGFGLLQWARLRAPQEKRKP